MSTQKFVHLHVHSDFSLLDASAKIDNLVSRAKELGMEALALTDHGNMFGVLRFEQACRKAGIKPIIGCEFYVAAGSRHEKKTTERGKNYYHLILLAKNEEGYRNLMHLDSIAYTEGMYYKPRIDDEVLRRHSGGLVCLTACLAGQLPQLLLTGKLQEAEEFVLRYQAIFGRENFFVELQDHGIPEQQQVTPLLINVAKKLNAPMVVTNDIHFVLREDHVVQDVMLCIGRKETRNDPKRRNPYNPEFYMKSADEMALLFPDHPEMMENTVRIADMCNLTIPQFSTEQLKDCLPVYQIPPEFATQDDYVRHLVYTGLEKRYPTITQEIRDRAEHELSVIFKMGFSGYFLIVWDFNRRFLAHFKGKRKGNGCKLRANGCKLLRLFLVVLGAHAQHIAPDAFLKIAVGEARTGKDRGKLCDLAVGGGAALVQQTAVDRHHTVDVIGGFEPPLDFQGMNARFNEKGNFTCQAQIFE